MFDKVPPAISVVIPAFNASKWIRETLRSVESQCDRIEAIVVDDGSSDETATIVETEFPWVTLMRQDNRGVSAARTVGTNSSCGRFIKYLDADDLLACGVLGRQLSLAESSGADVVYGNWSEWVQGESGDWCEGARIERRIEDVHSDYEVAFFTSMWCATSTYLWRSSFVKSRHPGWHMQLPVIQDARFPLDAVRAGATFVYDNAIAAFYRVHTTGSVSTTSRTRFLRDCLFNTKEMEFKWRAEGRFEEIRRKAALDSYASLARAGCNAIYEEAIERIQQIDSRFIPNSRVLGVMSKLIGFRAACQIARRCESISEAITSRVHRQLLLPATATLAGTI